MKLIPYEELVLKQKLGRGAGGVVWAATWKECELSSCGCPMFCRLTLTIVFRKEVAVKVLFSTQDGLNEEHLVEDLSEVKMLTSFQHPNIVEFHGLSIHDGDVCIVLELMEYGSLSNVITSLQHLVALETRLKLLVGAAEAL